MHKRLNQQPATAQISAWIGYISNIGLSEQNCNGCPDGMARAPPIAFRYTRCHFIQVSRV
ncbi:hypothetical protein ELG62_34450 (plasmid) [Rhizobium leguminosarum]|nr:hypothetical protein ELG62_34450 [Rhizobium leguminosarum]